MAAGCLGVIEDCLAEALDYARTRVQHGKPIGKHQLVQEHIVQIEMARAGKRRPRRGAPALAKAASDANYADTALASRADFLVAGKIFRHQRRLGRRPDRAVQVFGGRVRRLYRWAGTCKTYGFAVLRRDRRDHEAEDRLGPARQGFRRFRLIELRSFFRTRCIASIYSPSCARTCCQALRMT